MQKSTTEITDPQIDILNRDNYIKDVKEIIDKNVHSNISFAITGTWGCGKTFVIDRLEEQLNKNGSAKASTATKYLVLHYNCWEYDFYEEPLIAIVAVMYDLAKDKNSFFSKKVDDFIKNASKTALKTLTSVLDFIPEFNFIHLIAKDYKDSKKKRKTEEHSFDPYYTFKESLSKVQSLLDKFSEKYTLIIVVDELDRCLPPYAIKVLERLHHLTEGLNNVELIYAVAKEQLNETISQLYGAEVDIDGYLKKFISFEMPLKTYAATNAICEKYKTYINDYFNVENQNELVEFYSGVFTNIPVRIQEKLMKKAEFIHRMVFKEGKQNVTVLYFEMFLTVMISLYAIGHRSSGVDHWESVNKDKTVPINQLFSHFSLKNFKQSNFEHPYTKINCYHFILRFASAYNLKKVDSNKQTPTYLFQENNNITKFLYLWENMYDTNKEKAIFIDNALNKKLDKLSLSLKEFESWLYKIK